MGSTEYPKLLTVDAAVGMFVASMFQTAQKASDPDSGTGSYHTLASYNPEHLVVVATLPTSGFLLLKRT